MIHHSFRRSFFHFSTLNLTRPVTPAVTSSQQPVFITRASPRTFSSLGQDPDDQMAKNKNKYQPKGIKRKGPKRTSLDSGPISQTDKERAMSHRGDYYRSDQARERLESALWSQTSYEQQQQQQYSYQPPQGQQHFYQPPNWPPEQSTAQREREYAPGVESRTHNAESVLYTPPIPWETSAWTPPHHQPAPQPAGGFQHWDQSVSTAGGRNRPVTSSAGGGGNSPFYFDQGGPQSQSQRGYSSLSDPPPENKNEEGNSHPNSNSNTPRQSSSKQHKMGKKKNRGKFSQQNDTSHLRINESRDDISAPSPASGGVPDPTPSYLLRASFLPQTVPHPRPILVVIDLNGTMLFRPSRRQASTFVARPHAEDFLTYCIDTFHVVIWSSARPENVEAMCRKLLTGKQLDKVVARWGRDKFGLTSEDYNKRTQCYKRLTKLWEDPKIAVAHPDGEPWNQGNTVLIDDSTEKARSEPYNAITLPEFMGDLDERPAVLPLVHDYLNILAMQADISTFIRQNPFKLDGDYREIPAVKGPEEVQALPTGAHSAEGTVGKEIEVSTPEVNAQVGENTQ